MLRDLTLWNLHQEQSYLYNAYTKWINALSLTSDVAWTYIPRLEYLGVRPDSIGVEQHWYRIGEVEVPVDAIEELGNMEEVDESDTIWNLSVLSINEKSFYKP